MQCTEPKCGIPLSPTNFDAIKFVEDGDKYRVVCNFHYADWKERNKQ
jgi:hypothetical protein